MSGAVPSVSERAPLPVGDAFSGAAGPPARVDILGVGVSVLDMPTAVDVIDGWIVRREANFVCVRDVHGIMAARRNPELRQAHARAGLVTPDGMPVVWISRLRGYRRVRRVCGSDLMSEVCRASVARGYRHFLYGGAAGVPERLADRLRERFPGIRIVGLYSPPFRPLTPEEDSDIVRRINRSEADIVWVGLSTPKQELWMADHLGRLDAPVMLGVGAVFDFHAGLVRRAPAWMQRCGLEWAFRLAAEPRRLWRRYLTVTPLFVPLAILQALRLRCFPGED